MFGEKLKLKLALHFIDFNNIRQPKLMGEIKENLKKLKKCYDKSVIAIDDEELAGMLFVDGCAVVHLIYCIIFEEEIFSRDLKMKKDQIAFAQHDMFLLENQLPFLLLNTIVDAASSSTSYTKAVTEFIRLNLMVSGEDPYAERGKYNRENSAVIVFSDEDSPIHLLDLMRERLIAHVKDSKTRIGKASSYVFKLYKCICNSCKKQLGFTQKGETEVNAGKNWQSFRSVNELIESGVKFRPSSKISLRNVRFQGFWFTAVLKLPRLTMDDSTPPKLFNLVAYEMCPDFENDFEVISYVSLMDSLIDETADVRELRRAGILQNALGNDQEVADIFNEIAENLSSNPDIYGSVIKRLENRYKSKVQTAMAEFIHNHFRSPWTFLAFVGVIVGLGLSLVQTVYTIHPAS